jgi:hypothetical protein
MRTRVLEALRAADIAPERLGRARLERLTPPQRKLYAWILYQFAEAKAPSAEATRDAASGYGLDPAEALAVLAAEDLVHTDVEGRPLLAYPFSAVARGHRVVIDGSHKVEAMCAIDALGMSPMLARSIEVISHDPLSGGEVRVQLDPQEGASWEPESAVVVAGSASCGGPSFRGCCDVLNFFETRETAERYLREHPEVSGGLITIPEAIETGRAVFGDLLTED